MKFEINLCKTSHPHFPYVINKVKIWRKKKQQHLKTYLNKCLHLCIWTAKFELWEVFCCCWFVYLFNFKMAKKKKNTFCSICFCTIWKQLRTPPPPETDIDFRRREDHQSDLNIGLNVRIICLRIMLIGHRKDMKDCVYTNDFVLIYL